MLRRHYTIFSDHRQATWLDSRHASARFQRTSSVLRRSLLDDDDRLVSDDPGVMAGGEQRDVAGPVFVFFSVRRFRPEPSGDVNIQMRCPARLVFRARFYVDRPSPTGLEGKPSHGKTAELDHVDRAPAGDELGVRRIEVFRLRLRHTLFPYRFFRRIHHEYIPHGGVGNPPRNAQRNPGCVTDFSLVNCGRRKR